MFDKERIIFLSRMIGVVAKECNANCSNSEADGFVDYVYRHYTDAGSPKDCNRWLKSFLKDAYLYVTQPPIWVEEEPAWPYANNRPMIFIGQLSIPKTVVSEASLTWDTELYVFGHRVPCESGFRVEYRLVEQIHGLDGVGER